MMRIVILILIFFGVSHGLSLGQSAPANADTSDKKTVRIIHADEVQFEKTKAGLRQVLRGNVALYQDSTFFYCDSALVFNNSVWATGEIQILQGDSTSIFSDSLYYSGDNKKAKLYGEVALLNKNNELYTDSLDYDLAQKKADYKSKAYLRKGTTKINSNRGTYRLEENMAVFADSVVVVDSNFVLRADTLRFDTKEQTAYFHGPTSIDQDSSKIYCESGYYNFQSGKAEFLKNAAFRRGDQRGRAEKMIYDDSTKVITLVGRADISEGDQLVQGDSIVYFQQEERAEIHGNGFFQDSVRTVRADQIYYNEVNKSISTKGQAKFSEGDIFLDADQLDYDDETGNGLAIGNVVWKDTANDMAIHSDELYYNKETEYVKAIGKRPYMTIIMDGDTMYISGDTLLSERYYEPSKMEDSIAVFSDTLLVADTTILSEDIQVDTLRRIRIYNNVLIYKSDIQGVCDSMVYTEKDSAFTMMEMPVLWSDTSQFTGDTIRIFVKNKSVDYVFQRYNGMIINSGDLVYYNQIQGKEITSYFDQGKPSKTIVEGNAQSIYFALDEEDAYIAANKSICSRIRVHFEERKIRDIVFLTQPKAEMLPMSTPGLSNMRLEGFIWQYESRPKSKEDVIE